MFWKNSILSLGLLTVTASFTHFDEQQFRDEIISPKIPEDLQEILSSALQHRKIRKNIFLQNPDSANLFDPLLEEAQSVIDKGLEKLQGTGTSATPFSIKNNLLYLSLVYENMTGKTLTYCQNTLAQAKVDIFKASSESAKKAIFDGASEAIGQVIFLGERYPQTIANFIDLTSLSKTKKQIQDRFTQEFQNYDAACHAVEAQHQKTGIEDPQLVLSMLEPQILSNMLLTASGKLNLGLIPLLRKTLNLKNSSLEYQKGMDQVLADMDLSWQIVLDTVVKPVDQNSASEELVRADLGLSRSAPITDFHCKWTALKALLSRLYQGGVGNCFAVAWAIKKQTEHHLATLKDYGELLKTGYLTRTVNETADHFFFKNTLADSNLQKTLTLTTAGALSNGSMIWDAPGMVSACRQMGIDDMKAFTLEAIKPLFKKGANAVQTTPEELIGRFAALSIKKTGFTLDQAVLLGKYGFSQTQNHLLRAWETALAGMAEARKGDFVRDQIIASVHAALVGMWSKWSSELSAASQPLATDLQNSFENLINQQSRFVYNSAIALKSISDDGSSTNGGFELYKRLSNTPSAMGERVATPDEFRKFCIEVANFASTNLQSYNPSPDSQAAINKLSTNLQNYLQENAFLEDVLSSYDPANRGVYNPVINYESLAGTPMTTLQGDNPFKVSEIDTGFSFESNVKTMKPKNPYELIKWILDIAEWKETTQHYLEDEIPNELAPAVNTHHAFNIAFEEEDIKNFVLSKTGSDLWLEKTVIQPSVEVSQAIIDASTKSFFSNNFLNWLKQNVQLTPASLNYFQTAFASINQKESTVQLYASNFLKLLTNAFQANEETAKQLSLIFDTLFLQSLPVLQNLKLSEHCIRFARTNWNEGDKNLYFCTFLNPRTGQLSFGTIAEDKTNLMIMDEYGWVNQQSWQIVTVDGSFAL